MKHLKKLSVVLMITTLFSASFTSCIDTEVSPVVEAIYEAQADLIAAQTAVQNAEAALRTAQANAAQAQADFTAAQTAQVEAITDGIIAENSYQALKREQQLLKLVAETNLAVAQAQMDLEKEQAKFDIKMVELLAKLEEAKVQVAIGYAIDYRNAMWAANNIWSDLLDAKATLADAELMLVDPDGNGPGAEVSYAYHLAMLANAVAEAQASVDDIQAKLDLFNEHAEDPIAAKELLDAQKIELKAQYEILQQKRAEQLQVINDLSDEVGERNEYVDQLTGGFGTPLWDHNAAVQQKINRENAIVSAQTNIANWQAAMTNYEATKATLEQAVVDAEDRIGFDGTSSAADHEHNHPAAFGLLGDIDAATTALTPLNADVTDAENALGAPYVAPTSAAQSYVDPTVTAYDVLFNAELAILKHDAAYAALTATYNAAVNAYNQAKIDFDTADYLGALDTATDAVTLASDNVADGKTEYEAAKLAFEMDAASFTVEDALGGNSAAASALTNFDLGETGDGGAPITYMRVATWKQEVPGEFVPATFYPEKYSDMVSLDAAIDALQVTHPAMVDANIDLWHDGATLDIENYGTNVVTANKNFYTAAEVFAIDANTNAVFVDVAADDTSVSNAIVFNRKTNILGNDDFTTRPFFTAGTGVIGDLYTFNVPLVVGDLNADYNSATPETLGGNDTLTLQAVLWNALLEQFIKQNEFDLGDDLLQAKKDEYEAQKLLFDEGLETRNGVGGLVETAAAITAPGGEVYVAQANLTAAQNAVIAQQDVIDALKAELGSIEYITTGTAGPGQILRELNDGYLFISWDVHANDGVPAADVMYEYRADAGWETAYDGDGAMGDADALTAYAELWNAQEALARHTETTLAQYQNMIDIANASIDTYNEEIAALEVYIAAKYAVVEDLLSQLDDLGIEYTFEVDAEGKGQFEVTNDTNIGNSYTDLRAEIIAENQVLWNLDREIAVLQDQRDRVNSLIAAWNSSYNNFVNTIIPDLEEDLAEAKEDLAEAQAALALATNDEAAATANIEYLEAKVETLEARYANALAIAEKYKALLDAAIAS
ncbi:hypothetical protein [uncultured Lutibacter sp.]|uniref:hypothetical protein n=1 Tax=uncultured Lutibacter sp. TaxID=437739 RepID=UPI002615ECD3|nr:hypothetical protein [uncultured Lutibacter sp.]